MMNKHIFQNVISINNRCVDQIGEDTTSIVSIIAEMQRAVSLIQQVVTPVEVEPSSSSDILHSTQHQTIPVPTAIQPPESAIQPPESELPSPTTTTIPTTSTMIRIQFRSDTTSSPVQRRTETFQHSKSPIVACLCPIVLVEDTSIRNHSMATTVTSMATHPPPHTAALASSNLSTHDALHLVSAAILLNIAMLFHRMAFQQNSMTDSDAHRRRGAASYWMRTMEMYELLIQLFNKDSLLEREMNTDHMNSSNYTTNNNIINNNSDRGCIHTRQYMAYMRMMKTVSYNNYAQLCYETGNYIHYIPCMDGLYHQLHQLLPFLTDSTTVGTCHLPITGRTAVSSSPSHDATVLLLQNHNDDPNHFFYSSSAYQPIFATIQLNVLVGQLLAIPQIARAA